ncbi:DUF6443 domain-containing protein [Bacteroides sp.]|uniref:DUF6443 domain-containing protein n=1 Tax=Bacteroides sp. TaxID=29523 RepID=UPI003A930A61
MKRFSIFLLLLIAACVMNAQVSTENYIRTRRMLNDTGSSYLDDIAYYDGLGRPFQTVQKAVKNGSPVNKNLATLQEYDATGREGNSWLPIPISSSVYLAPAAFKSSAPGKYSNDSRPYSQPFYEASPLNRILQQCGPGTAWYNAGRPVKTEYLTNTATLPLNCRCYTVNDSYTLSGGSSSYAAGQLLVVKTMDEDMNVSYSFTDKLGHLVLTRQMQGSEPHDTYYVYDEKGNLCFVLQPMYQNSANLDLYAFQYKYDGRNRCVYKKLPGAKHITYTYNDDDQLIYSQDGRQRSQKKLTYYKYDYLRRMTCWGECTDDRPSISDRVEFKSEIPTSIPVIYVRNYYDDYSFVGGSDFPAFSFIKDTAGHGKGLLTGSCITILGTDMKIYVAHYYDIKGRETKTVQSNLLGGYDVTVTTYTFTDKPATVTHTHTANGKSTWTEAYTYTYDHANRISKVQHTFGGTTITLYDALYDDFGRLMTKSLHGSTTSKLTYTYNLRGWLTEITGARFTQNMYYNTGVGTAKYNGSISSMTWKAGNESTVRGYKFTYDGLDRLQNAIYGESASINANTNRFSEKVTAYDKNGNILALQRYGQTIASAYGLIDNLKITLNGNQLKSVNDAIATMAYNNSFEFKNGANATTEYMYDANGNLTKDLNKNITDIQYNFLNLPDIVTFSDGSTISYLYSADGVKLRTIHKIGTTTTTTYYCNNVVYENGVQKLLLTEEGYLSLNDNKYHYYLKDHQGNNRVVINQNGNVEETNHYYPFGGVFASSQNVQPYKYNGKELDTKKGLNLYDYGARQYDAAIGRFTTMDPMTEKYYEWSPYTYCKNNPINRIDPDGNDDYVIEPRGRLHNMTHESQRGKSEFDRLYNSSGTIKIQRGKKSIKVSDTKLLSGMLKMQSGKYKNYGTVGSTENLDDAARVFKFAADNSNAEWRLDVYDDNGTKTAVIATKQDGDHVQNADKAKRYVGAKGDQRVNMHSHPNSNGTKGGSPDDISNARQSPTRNIVYFKANQTLYEYNGSQSKIKEMPIETSDDILKQMGLK